MSRVLFRIAASVWLAVLAALAAATVVGLAKAPPPDGSSPRSPAMPPPTWIETTYERLAFEPDGSALRFEKWETLWERATVGDRVFVQRKKFAEAIPSAHRCVDSYPRAERGAALRSLLVQVRAVDGGEDEVVICADGGRLAFTAGSSLLLVDEARRFTAARGGERLPPALTPWVRAAVIGLLDPDVGGQVYVQWLEEAAAGCDNGGLYPALGLLVNWPGDDRLALWLDAIRRAGECPAVLRLMGGHIGSEVEARGAEVVPTLDRAADAMAPDEEREVARLLGPGQPLGARCAAVHILRRRAGAAEPFEVSREYAERGEAWRAGR